MLKVKYLLRFLAVAAAAWIIACEGADSPRASSTPADEFLALRVQWTMGRVEGAGPGLFGDISGLLVDDLGRVHALDAMAGEVRVFGSDGSFVRTYGRRGQGPGELLAPAGMAVGPEGAVWLLDVSNNRFSVYDTAGHHVTDVPRPADGYSNPWLGGFDGDGRLVDATFRAVRGESELILVRSDVVRGPDGRAWSLQPVDTFPLPRPPADRFLVYEVDPSGLRRGVSVAIPFSSGLRREFVPGGTIWEADTRRYRIVEYEPGGDTLRRVQQPHRAAPVTDRQLDSALVVLADRTSPDLSYDADRIPGEWPALESFFADGQGRLWVRPIESRPVRGFDLHDGARVRRVASPAVIESNPRPQVRGDTLWGVTRGELGAARIVKAVLVAGVGESGE